MATTIRRPSLTPVQVVRHLLAGYVATLVMEQASGWWYERQDQEARAREEELRKEMPTTVLADKIVRLLGLRVEEEAEQRLGMGLHYGFGAVGGVGALLLRRWGWRGLPAGVAVGLAMSASVDEGLNYLLGLTAPPASWPWQAHTRGIFAHLAYGTALGLLVHDP